jgi:hypothetical protein
MEERFVWGLEGSKRDSVSPKRREMRGGLDDQQQVQDRIFGNKKTSMHADADRNGGVICASALLSTPKLLPYPRIERERQVN